MNKNRKGQLSTAAVLLLVIFLSAISLSWKWHHFSLKRQAKPMIEALERHRQRHGTYPQDSAAAGFPIKDESGPLYYQRHHPTEYIIWHGTTLGESVIYHSTDAKWQ